MGKQVVAEVDWFEGGVLVAMRGQPAVRRAVFTVLLFRAVPGDDELGFQRHDLGMSGRDDGCPEHGVEIFGLAVAPKPFRALRAMNFGNCSTRLKYGPTA